MGELKKKKVKVIKIDLDKCNGCRSCEMICSAFHAKPKYSSNNPERSRIRLIREPIKDIDLPYTPVSMLQPNVWAETNIRLTESNTTNVTSAGLPARPGSFSKNPIPVSL